MRYARYLDQTLSYRKKSESLKEVNVHLKTLDVHSLLVRVNRSHGPHEVKNLSLAILVVKFLDGVCGISPNIRKKDTVLIQICDPQGRNCVQSSEPNVWTSMLVRCSPGGGAVNRLEVDNLQIALGELRQGDDKPPRVSSSSTYLLLSLRFKIERLIIKTSSSHHIGRLRTQ